MMMNEDAKTKILKNEENQNKDANNTIKVNDNDDHKMILLEMTMKNTKNK